MVSILSLGRQVSLGCDHRVNPTDNSISHFDCLYMCVCVCAVLSPEFLRSAHTKTEPAAVLSLVFLVFFVQV